MYLRLHDLACARGGMPVLEHVNCDLGQGQGLILRGPNGVGKTTLLRTLAGLQPPLSGRCEISPEMSVYASHADGIKAALSVAENLQFWAAIYGREVPAAVWDDFDLAVLRDRSAGALSAGQKRRLGLARIAVTGRRILLLDEPTVSLDTASVRLFAHWLRLHLDGGGIAVIATHIDLGLDLPALDLSAHIAARDAPGSADEAFL